LEGEIPGFLRLRDGRPAGYFFGTLFGHSRADSDEDLLALAGHAARHLPPPLARFICPMARPGLYRKALAAGHRTGKVVSYMSFGEYVAPCGPQFPSIQC